MIRLLDSTNELELFNMRTLRNRVLRLPLLLDLFEEDLDAELHDIVVVHMEEEQVNGVVMAKVLRHNNVAKLRQMAVSHEQQGKGIGAQLVGFLEQRLQSLNVYHIELHARITASDFYKKLGYQEQGQQFIEVGLPHVKMTKVLPPLL